MPPLPRAVRVGADVDLHVLVWEPASAPQPETFLLVHGLASNAQLWLGVGDRLAAAGHRVLAVDQRGHGLSSKPDDGYDPDTISDDLRAVCAAMDVTLPIAVGQSWGGNVVLHLATRPGAVRGVACIDGGHIDLARAFGDWDRALEVLTPPRLAGMRADELTAGMRTRLAGWPASGIQGQLANFVRLPDGTVAPHLTLDRHLAILRSMWDHPPSADFPDVTVPVLLLPVAGGPGSDHKAAAVAAAEAALPRSRTVWLDGSHDVHAEDPERTATALLATLTDGFWS